MPFQDDVFEAVKKIPRGRVTTYKLVAQKLNTSAFRAVGQALKKNRSAQIPCHRVINSNTFVGQYNRGINEKIRLLKSEGITVSKDKKIKNLERYLFKFE